MPSLPLPLNIALIYLKQGEELRKIIAVPNQHQVVEFPADRVLESRHLFAGADAGTDNWDLAGFIIDRRMFPLSSAKHERFIYFPTAALEAPDSRPAHPAV